MSRLQNATVSIDEHGILTVKVDVNTDALYLSKSGQTYVIAKIGQPGFVELLHPTNPYRGILVNLAVLEGKSTHENWIEMKAKIENDNQEKANE